MDAVHKCQRCGSPSAARQFYVSLIHQDGMEDGEHVADVELWICPRCIERVANLLLLFTDRWLFGKVQQRQRYVPKVERN